MHFANEAARMPFTSYCVVRVDDDDNSSATDIQNLPNSPSSPNSPTESAAGDDLNAGDLTLVRRAADRDRADEWTLVLAAMGLPSRVLRLDDGTLAIVVPSAQAAAALRALTTYDRESREPMAGTLIPAPRRGGGALGLVVGALLALFERFTGFWEQVSSTGGGTRLLPSGTTSVLERLATQPWFAAGVADAKRIRAGDWWRNITAITVHADLMHLVGNVVASAIFIGAAGRWLGWGVAAALIVVAASGANLLTAYADRPSHLSVGASTATFAALGLLVGLQLVHRWRSGGFTRRRSWIAFGAGMALLAMLGMGQQSDVFAHAFSLGLGIPLGAAAGATLDHPRVLPRTTTPVVVWGQRGMAVLVLAGIAWVWRVALARM